MNMQRFFLAIVLMASPLLAAFPSPVHAAPCLLVTLTGTMSGPVLLNGVAGAGTLVRYGDDSNDCSAVKLQFDAGRGTALRLSQVNLDVGQLDAIFFTHMHSDHAEGFADLMQARWNWNSAGPKLDVVCSADAPSPLEPLRLAAGIAVQRAALTRRKYARHASAEAGGPTARVPRQRALNSSFRCPSAPLSPSRAAGAKPSRGTTSPCRRRHRLAALALAHSALRRSDLVHRVLAAHGPAIPFSASRSRLAGERFRPPTMSARREPPCRSNRHHSGCTARPDRCAYRAAARRRPQD